MAAAAEEALQVSVTKLVGCIFGTVRAQLESETVRKQREIDLEIEAVVTQLLDKVFATVLTKGGQQQQQQQQQQQSASAPALAPRRSILDAVGHFMGSMGALFGGGKQEQEQAQAQEEGAQNSSSPAPPPPDPLAAEVGEWVSGMVGRVFEQAHPWPTQAPALSRNHALALSLTQAPALSLNHALALSLTRTCGVPSPRPATRWTRRGVATLQPPRSRHASLPTYARRAMSQARRTFPRSLWRRG